MKLVKLNDRTYINLEVVVMVAFNAQTFKTAVMLNNGLMVESEFTFDETVKALNG